METQFYILLSLKTLHGYETYGQYFLGNNRHAANALFDSLKGAADLDSPTRLHMDLMETIDELPVRIKTIGCTLEELACNSKLIAREIFMLKNLKEWS